MSRDAAAASHYDYWHDRAVLHFLTDTGDDAGAMRRNCAGCWPQGRPVGRLHPAGPDHCSGPVVARASRNSMPCSVPTSTARHRGRNSTARPVAPSRPSLYALYRARRLSRPVLCKMRRTSAVHGNV